MSFHILNTGASALRASQRAVETAAHNAANSTVEGYTRQRVAQVAMVPAQGADGVLGSGHRGTGVQVVGIERLRDVLADLALRSESSRAGREQVRAEVLDRAQSVLGQYGSGLPDALSKLWGAFDQLALNPAEPAARQIVVDTALSVANGLNAAARGLQDIRTDSITRADDEVREINTLAQEVASLNVHIVAARNGGQSPNDLLDRRDVILDRLAVLVGGGSRPHDDGSVTVTVKGSPLVQGATAFPLLGKAQNPPAGATGTEYSLWLNGVRIDDDQLGGQLGGRVDALRDDLREIERQLNAVARTLADEVNLTQVGGTVTYVQDGVTRTATYPGGFDREGRPGIPFFTTQAPATWREGGSITAANFAVNPALLGPTGMDHIAAAGTQAPAGSESLLFDGQNALRLARLRSSGATSALAVSLEIGRPPAATRTAAVPDAPAKAVSTVNQMLNGVASTLGSAAAGALAAAETSRTAVSALKDQRSAVNGVSLDEEMVELVKFQHAYDAAARVISIADQMLNTLINGMGAGR